MSNCSNCSKENKLKQSKEEIKNDNPNQQIVHLSMFKIKLEIKEKQIVMILVEGEGEDRVDQSALIKMG